MYLDAAVRKLCACGALDHLLFLFCPVNFICGKNSYHSGKLLIVVLNHKVASLSRVTNSTKKKKKKFHLPVFFLAAVVAIISISLDFNLYVMVDLRQMFDEAISLFGD